MTMKQAAVVLGLPYTTYVNYEKGVREPNSETLIKLADYYNVSTDYLMGRTLEKEISFDPAPTENGERAVSDAELKFALWGDCEDVDNDDLADVRRYAAFVRERKKDRK